MAHSMLEEYGSGTISNIILLSDGNFYDTPQAYQELNNIDKDIKISALAIGTLSGAPYKVAGELYKTNTGDIEISKLNTEVLKNITKKTGGQYFILDNLGKTITKLTQDILHGNKAINKNSFESWQDTFYWFLIPICMLCLFYPRLLLSLTIFINGFISMKNILSKFCYGFT